MPVFGWIPRPALPITTEKMVDKRRRIGIARLASTIVAAAAATVLWSACSVEKDYETLSFFFDGVPESGSEEAADGAGGAAGISGAGTGPVSSHSAYVDRRCESCHGDRASFGFYTTGFSDLGDDTCLPCHSDVDQGFDQVHGPVAAGLCLGCHEAHISRYPKLLVDASPSLCLGCHGTELDQSPRPSPAHADLGRDCLDCHGGHGGSGTYLLRADSVAPPAPVDSVDPGPVDPADPVDSAGPEG